MSSNLPRRPNIGAVWAAALLAAVTTLGGCSSTAPSQTMGFVEPITTEQRDYHIAPGDILELKVYQFDKLDRTVQVDGDGRISMPLIGAVRAAGRTVIELESDVAHRYGARYLQSPQISVFVKESAGLRVTVDGAVRKPGVYSLKGRTTLLQALAQAEGLNEVGDAGAVKLIRASRDPHGAVAYDLETIRAGQTADPVINGGDTIVVDESMTRHGLQMLKAAAPGAAAAAIWRIQ